jgi:hypothetical protein
MSIYNALCTNAKCEVFLSDYADERVSEQRPPAFCPVCGSPVIDSCPHCHTATLEVCPSPNYCACGQRLRFDPDPITHKITIIVDE